MNRLVAVSAVAALAAGLLGWSAPVAAQPPLGSLPTHPPAAAGNGWSDTAVSPPQWAPPNAPAVLPDGPAKAPAAPAALPAARVADVTAAPDNTAARQEAAVSLEWQGTAAAKVGQANTFNLVVRNSGAVPVQQVLVRVRVPAGMSCGGTEPRAVAEGNVLIWELGTLQARQEKTLRIKLTAEQRGDLTPQAWVTFTGSAVTHVRVRQPMLELRVKAPPRLLLGEPSKLMVTISNPGDGTAEGVKVHAVLSEGLEAADAGGGGNPHLIKTQAVLPDGPRAGRGPRIDFDIGNLVAGETRRVTVPCTGKVGGVQKCELTAEAEGGLRAGETVSLNVTTPRLELRVSGPGLRYLGRKALYTLRVTNPGDAPAGNVVVRDVVPEGFKVLAATDGGRYDPSARTVFWMLGEVAAGQTREVKVEVQAVSPGDYKLRASVSAGGLAAEAEARTRVEGLSALMLEMVDTDDPVEVNGDTSYEVRVTNTGSQTETDIRLVASVPEKMAFKSATAPVRFHEEGRTIIFEPLEKLAPKAEAVFRIHVRALEAGTVRFKIQLTSTNLTEPVIKMEPTRIYADSPN